MTDEKLRHLSRAELIDITYEQQKRLEASEKTVRDLQERLKEKELLVSEAGSIAEAALKVNGVFEAAQAAADQYLISVQAASANAKNIISEAEKQRDDILRSARRQADEIIRNAEAGKTDDAAGKVPQEKWPDFEQYINEILAPSKGSQVSAGKGSSL